MIKYSDSHTCCLNVQMNNAGGKGQVNLNAVPGLHDEADQHLHGLPLQKYFHHRHPQQIWNRDMIIFPTFLLGCKQKAVG